jgi:hypothetical protein
MAADRAEGVDAAIFIAGVSGFTAGVAAGARVNDVPLKIE